MENFLENKTRILKILFGNILITATYAFLTVPNHIVNGGVTSFSMIFSEMVNINISIVVNTITILLLILCGLFLGRSFFNGSIFSCVCYLGFFTFFSSLDISFVTNPIILVLIAGTTIGIGYYFCISAESTAIGFDVIALILNKYNPKINISIAMGTINICVLMLGFFNYGIISVILGIILTVVQSFTLNNFLKLTNKNNK